jgi:hypothetical protein
MVGCERFSVYVELNEGLPADNRSDLDTSNCDNSDSE